MASEVFLPDDCWEQVFKIFLIDGGDSRYLESLSLFSKQFLSITNRLRFSLTICNPTLPFLPNLLHRFLNLTSIDFTHFSGDLDALLSQISCFPLKLTSLNLSNQPTIPTKGLQAFSHKITTLTSLKCSNIVHLRNYDLILISKCFPFLEELDLSDPVDVDVLGNVMPLPRLRKVNLSGHSRINKLFLLNLCKNCEFLEEIVMLECKFITIDVVSLFDSAIRERPGLRALSFTNLSLYGNYNIFIDSLVSLKGLTCLNLSHSFITDELLSTLAEEGLPLRRLILQGSCGYSYVGLYNLLNKCQFFQYLDLQGADFLNDSHVIELSSFLVDLESINFSNCGSLTNLSLFALLANCFKLSEVRMEYTNIGKRSVKNSSYTLMNFSVFPQLKSLRLAHNKWLRDEDINMFASVFPNLQLLDLSSCNCISGESISEVLRKCSKIRHFKLDNLKVRPGLKLLGMNFKASMLEVLNLSASTIDDRSLNAIAISCFGLLQLDLRYCYDVTEKGVMQVVEYCTQLREINLYDCCKVIADVGLMVLMRPSLRKITAPPSFSCCDKKRKLFLNHGCVVC